MGLRALVGSTIQSVERGIQRKFHLTVFGAGILFGVVGLAALHDLGIHGYPEILRNPRPQRISRRQDKLPLQEYVGVLHVHTKPFSDDAGGSIDDVVKALGQAYCDFTIITDHNSIGQRERQGLCARRNKQLLVIVGEEVSTPSGHLLVINHPTKVWPVENTKLILDATSNAVNIVAHPYAIGNWKKEHFLLPEIDGFEIYNFSANVLKKQHTITPSLYLFGGWGKAKLLAQIVEHNRRALRTFDRIAVERFRRYGKKTLAVASIDAHQNTMYRGVKVDLYQNLFKLCRLHVLSVRLGVKDIETAIAKGNFYNGFDMWADTSGFKFYAKQSADIVGVMGDLVTGDSLLYVELPRTGIIRLYRNGNVIMKSKNKNLTFKAGPGVYRVEVDLKTSLSCKPLPWIYSNPLYIQQHNITLR